ncbi:MAG: hypothetical protein KDB18_10980, partial [Salinibacterium sp.]|nr:hypothetical protein [Salinibacterium sp.]
MNRQIRWALLAAVCATLGSALQAQQVYLTTRGPALGGGAPDDVIASSELLQWTANTAGARHHLTESSIATMIGDGNGNGILDDGPARIDALCPTPTGFAGDLTGFLVSFATTVTFGDGTVVTDGDLVSLDPSGTTRVIFSEADLAAATGTTGIDLDAAHLA